MIRPSAGASPATGALVPTSGPASSPASLERERYTVLLLDEDQLDRFLARPRASGATPVRVRRKSSWPRVTGVTIRRAALTAALLTAAATMWVRGPASDLEAAIGAVGAGARQVPMISTGTSFSVRIARFAAAAEARAAVGRLVKAGFPAFAMRMDGRLPDLLVGPFVSIDEAERAQRALAGRGLGRSRLHVDDRLPPTPTTVSATPAVLAVAAPGREALVFELSREPRATSGDRIDATTFDVVTSPTGEPIEAQEWRAPGGLHLIHHVVVQADPTGERGLTARVTVARDALARVRVERSRVYVDVQEAASSALPPAVPTAVPTVLPRAPGPVNATRAPAAAPVATARTTDATAVSPDRSLAVAPRTAAVEDAADDRRRYREAIAPVFARFEEIRPFLRAAVGQEGPEVLAALAGTFGELEQTLRGVPVPPGAAAAHSLLASAVRLAKDAVSVSSPTERAVQVREATAQFQAARARLEPGSD